jgi:hypothetical protein
MKKNINILVMNLKGGAGKSTNSTIIASYLKGAKLIEIDKINESASKIKSDAYFTSSQIDFKHERENSFFEFEEMLLSDGIKIIDVGAVKLEILHNSLVNANLYDMIDLIVIPAMDGRDDFNVAMNFVKTLKDNQFLPMDKIMFSFNRFNNHEYSTPEDQYDNFFDNAKVLKDKYQIDLNDHGRYYVLQDSYSIKRANRLGVTIRSLADTDMENLTKKQRSEKDSAKRLELTKMRSLVSNAKNFERDYIVPMMHKITAKLENNKG